MRAIYMQVWKDFQAIGCELRETYLGMWRIARRVSPIMLLMVYVLHFFPLAVLAAVFMPR